MKRAARTAEPRPFVPRKTIFELPPLELECMKVLWGQPGVSVREIRAQLDRPLAYTTVETIMDRLTRKGAVSRRKVGKAHRYTALYEKSAARAQAVAAVAEHFFEGSRAALRAHLDGGTVAEPRRPSRPLPAPVKHAPVVVARPRAAARASKSEPPIDTTLL